MHDKDIKTVRKYSRRAQNSVFAVLAVLACLFSAVYVDTHDDMDGITGIFMMVLIHVFPLALLSALYSTDAAVFVYAVVFIIGIVTLQDVSIIYISHLLYIYIVNLFKNKLFYGSMLKTLLAAVVSGLFMGIVYYFLFALNLHISFAHINPAGVALPVLMAMPQCLFTHVMIYLIFKFMPAGITGLFPAGCFANGSADAAEKRQTRLGEKKLSRRMSAYLAIEAGIMAVGAVIFANLAIPDINSRNYTPDSSEIISSYMPVLSELGYTGHLFSDHYNNFENHGDMLNISIDAWIDFDLHLILFLIELIVPVAVLFRMLVHRKVTAPVQNITGCMEEYYSDNSENARKQATDRLDNLKIKTGDEIQSLHETLMLAVKDINRYIDRLQEEQRLREELRVAQAANEAKTEFLSRVSHEIRTPINSILGFDEMIQRESAEPEIRKYAADIQNSGRTLLSLINDILDSSRIESGRLEIIPVEYDLSPMISDLVNMVSVKTKEKNLEFIVNVDPKLPSALLGDEIRIKQCILNVLTNAVKYTKEGSVTLNIGFRNAESDGFIYLKAQVTDTGIGIKQEDMDKLFKPFERIEEERSRNVEGTGLGMSIVRNLLGMMGSELEVSSIYGSGSDFSFEVLQKVVKKEPVGDFAKNYTDTAQEETAYKESFQAPDARVLVVDDMKLNLSVFCGLLKNTRVVIDTAESGFAAIKLVKENAYDVIFLDQRMPDMDGVETLHILKEMNDNLSISAPVIVLTANAVSGAREQYIAEGFDDYVSKPVDGRKLEEILRQYLPASKVFYPDHPDFADSGKHKEDSRISALKLIPEISYETAMKNCAREEILLDAVSDFVNAAGTISEDIRKYHSAGDYRNLTVKVHGLKSSAALVGAVKLSGEAAYLEKCGDEGKNDEIDARLEGLLNDYGTVSGKLAAAAGINADNTDGGEKAVISESELNEAYQAIHEFAEAMDYDGVDDIMKQLSGYRMPDGEAERYERLKALTAALNRDEILKLV